MTIQVELSPETAARLAPISASRRIDPGEYAGQLLDSAIATVTAPPATLTVEEFHAILRKLAEGSEKLPALPTSAFSRESFYEDRP